MRKQLYWSITGLIGFVLLINIGMATRGFAFNWFMFIPAALPIGGFFWLMVGRDENE